VGYETFSFSSYIIQRRIVVNYSCFGTTTSLQEIDIHGSVHYNTILTKMTNKLQLCRIIYYSLTALHVLRNIFAHHQEHLNCNYSSWFYSRVSSAAATLYNITLKYISLLRYKTRGCNYSF
jgi:hypothetical protein